MLKKLTLLLILILSFLSLNSCGSRKPKGILSSEKRYLYAMELFNDDDYLDAKTEFRIIVLNFPGHAIVDKAQYHLAECHFQLKEYILAIAEYEKLLRMYPNSDLADDAQYQVLPPTR